MNRHISSRGIYQQTATGILVPAGSTTDVREISKSNIAATKLDGLEMLRMFRNNGLDPNRSPSLKDLVKMTARLSDALLTARDDQTSYAQLFSALQLRRIIDAVNAITNEPALPRLLSELLNGTINLLNRAQSKAKDTLWEVELFRSLRENGISAHIGEPDLILAASETPIGVACKKVYSPARFPAKLSIAIEQIERTSQQGIVAVNIDDLVPSDSILKARNEQVAAELLTFKISEFMIQQERHLRRYIEPGRAIAIIVSCAALTDLQERKPRFCTFRQSIVWHKPAVSEQIDTQFNAILATFTSRATYA